MTPDGLSLGPLSLSWPSLTLVLGTLTWLALARFTLADRALALTLLAARLWAALPGWSTERPLLQNVLDILDVRRGDWAWGIGLLAGIGYLLWHMRRGTLRQDWLRPVALSVLAGLLPLSLRPAPTPQKVVPSALATISATQMQQPTPVPLPTVLNFWATWCGPCRSELPLLASAVAHGANVTLVNVGESPAEVQAFVRDHAPNTVTRLNADALAAQLQVTAFPTTVVLDKDGRVIARHLGPLSAAQLKNLIRLTK